MIAKKEKYQSDPKRRHQRCKVENSWRVSDRLSHPRTHANTIKPQRTGVVHSVPNRMERTDRQIWSMNAMCVLKPQNENQSRARNERDDSPCRPINHAFVSSSLLSGFVTVSWVVISLLPMSRRPEWSTGWNKRSVQDETKSKQ